jgi:hypothetical protein
VAIKIEGKIKNEAMENCLSLPHTGALWNILWATLRHNIRIIMKQCEYNW